MSAGWPGAKDALCGVGVRSCLAFCWSVTGQLVSCIMCFLFSCLVCISKTLHYIQATRWTGCPVFSSRQSTSPVFADSFLVQMDDLALSIFQCMLQALLTAIETFLCSLNEHIRVKRPEGVLCREVFLIHI